VLATTVQQPRRAQATCLRASRAARPATISAAATSRLSSILSSTEQQFIRDGRVKLLADVNVTLPPRKSTSAGRGPAIRVKSGDLDHQRRLNHLSSVKSRQIGSSIREPPWLLHPSQGGPCPLSAGRLAAAAVRSNAVNSSVTARRATQAATMQSSRINSRAITQVVASQASACLVAMAVAKRTARMAGLRIGNYLAASATNPAALYTLRPSTQSTFLITSTTRLPLTALPNKLSITSIVRASRYLAKLEVEQSLISERMSVSSCDTKLSMICNSIHSRRGAFDSVWSSFILIAYLTSHHTGRSLLRKHTTLTDFDYQTASVFENYGRGEITRRARLEASQQPKPCKRKCTSNITAIADISSAIQPMQLTSSLTLGTNTNETVKTETGTPSSSQATLSLATTCEIHDESDDDLKIGDESGTGFSNILVDEATESQQLLAVKRKRGARCYSGASSTDSSCVLSWWLAALQHGQASVLFSLVSESRATAKAAAQLTLQSQAQGCAEVAENQRIIEISQQNAIESACALVPLVGRSATDTPGLIAWSYKGRQLRSIMRASDEYKSTMAMALTTPHHALEPCAETKLWISWMEASLAFMPFADDSSHSPGIIERLSAADALSKNGKRSSVVASRIRASALMDAEQPRTPGTSGLTRSTISLEMVLRIDLSVLKAGQHLGTQLSQPITASLHPSSQRRPTDDPSTASGDDAFDKTITPNVIGCIHDTDETRLEPMCLPSSPLAVGLEVGEQLREWFSGKSRRNNPTKAALSTISASELTRDVPSVINQEPPPLLHITDVEAEMCGVEGEDVVDAATEEEGPTVVTKMAVTMHVCGDAAVRVPEAIGIYHKLYKGKPLLIAQRTRSLLLGAINQASWMADVGPAITAGWSNSAIQSSRKVAVADSHRLLFLSPFDAYVVGLSSLEKAHPASPYASTYGSSLDTGLTPPGLLGSNYRADRRQHGSLTLSQDVADECSEHFAHAHYRPVGDTAYVEIPPACRGIPHSLPVSLYTGLDELEAALDDVRLGVGKVDENFVPALQVLPFSPWTQALSPYIDLATDPTIRLGVRDEKGNSFNTGTAYLPDSTSFQDAIAREPLFRRPSQLSNQDNPFLTPHGANCGLEPSKTLNARFQWTRLSSNPSRPQTYANFATRNPRVVARVALCRDLARIAYYVEPETSRVYFVAPVPSPSTLASSVGWM
jgi:hypothetical protein